ncbi:hypothetical protein RF11_12716 [Thelohanellus kitauei]|uniref:Uncharacterized protein n=1 Tax=Thelohanellus kitauei TaxID=669202 RepID=A0A0C2MYI9_THEKT|nr:hypothetical protein RF11_12716 [Thelohanellus kitauei]
MNKRVLMIAKCSDAGRMYTAALILDHIAHICGHFIKLSISKTYSFLNLVTAVVICQPVVVYLIENGFLFKSIDVCSSLLKRFDTEVGIDAVLLHEKGEKRGKDLLWILETQKLLYFCLRVSVKNSRFYAKFKSQILDACRRFVQYCFEWSDIQPIQKGCTNLDEDAYKYLFDSFQNLFRIFTEFVKLFIGCDEVATEAIEWFLERFAIDIARISGEDPNVPVFRKIINYCNVDKDKFLIFNISHRVLIDIFMDSCARGTLTKNIKERVLGDSTMLMWIARPAVTAISYISTTFELPRLEMTKPFKQVRDIYFEPELIEYLQMQDIHIIQILMSHLDPELLLKYFLFNISPSIREHSDFIQPISSILCSQEFYGGYNLKFLFVLIYNAFLERHFIGVSENTEYPFIEGQLVNHLALGDRTLIELRNNIFVYRTIWNSDKGVRNMNVDQALE